MSAPPTITREQFIATSQRAQKKLGWVLVPWFVWFFGGMAVAMQFLPPEIRNKPVWNDHRSALVFLGHLGTSIALLFWGLNTVNRRLGLFCPSCAKLITGSQIVIASGNCGHCGSAVLSLPAPEGGPA